MKNRNNRNSKKTISHSAGGVPSGDGLSVRTPRRRAGASVPEHEDRTAEPEIRPAIPPRRKVGMHRRKFIAGLLSAVIPGSGHLYLGLIRKGISVMFLMILDLAALLYFSSIGIQINVPLLILLALLVPVLYFYNVFDVLQSADRIFQSRKSAVSELSADFSPAQAPAKKNRRIFVGEPEISFGLLLIFGGALLFLFRQKPPWFRWFLEQYASALTAGLLVAAGLWIALREGAGWGRSRRNDRRLKLRVGRYTASVILIGIAVPLFIDWRSGTDYFFLILKWWPVIPVLWGVEYLLFYLIARRKSAEGKGVRFRLDLRGVLSAIVLSASVFVVAEQQHYLHLWNKVSLNLTAAAVDYGEAQGASYEKPVLTVPVELSTSKITLDAINGDILLHRGPVEDVEIRTTVWVDQLDGAQAEAAAERAFIEVDEGTNISLRTISEPYGESGKRQPRMDLDITLPDSRRFNLEIRTMNGGITLQNVEAIQDISLETGNGPIILNRVFGNVKGQTLNGPVRVREIRGNVELSTSGGEMNAWDVSGSLVFNTAVGNMSSTRGTGDIKLSTKNGNIDVAEARALLKAESFNGKIGVRSPMVGGDWEIYSAVGDIDLRIPADGDFELTGSSGYGDINAELPGLSVDKKEVSGILGSGEFKIKVEGNSNLNVVEY